MSTYSRGNLFVSMANFVSKLRRLLSTQVIKMTSSIPDTDTSSFNESGMLLVLIFSVLHNEGHVCYSWTYGHCLYRKMSELSVSFFFLDLNYACVSDSLNHLS